MFERERDGERESEREREGERVNEREREGEDVSVGNRHNYLYLSNDAKLINLTFLKSTCIKCQIFAKARCK